MSRFSPSNRAPVSTVSEAVEACVRDCLILEASEVHVEVDFGCSSFRVIDNGLGMSKEDLRVCANGGGPAEGSSIGLGSVCRCAVVDIQSRQRGRFETYRCVCRGGSLLEIKPCVEGKSRAGTIVAVKDCFFSQPIPQCLGGGNRWVVCFCCYVVVLGEFSKTKFFFCII